MPQEARRKPPGEGGASDSRDDLGLLFHTEEAAEQVTVDGGGLAGGEGTAARRNVSLRHQDP